MGKKYANQYNGMRH